ncbi:hypothetical protein [Pendulispora albinea]|uniref:Zinc ribbon domain-containing protein n=1 Tax=Pendulispora albinea TaxID=2741071 RepID=A0ABZ2LY74_9BACT
MDPARCVQCGAHVPERICAYCGTLARPASGVAAQLEALTEFHALLPQADPARQKQLLTTGYFPSHWQALVEAGLQCYPLLRDGEADGVSQVAANRLEAIAMRLRIQGNTPEAQRAIAEFEARVKRFQRAESRLTVIAVGVLLALVGLVIWGVVAFLRR